MKFHCLLAACAALISAPALAAPIPQPIADPAPTIALTFDDLPVHGPLPPGMTRVELAARVIHTLQDAGAPPAYGFINAKGAYDETNSALALTVWRAAGFPLGNHTWSHMDLDKNTVEDWEDNVLKDEPLLTRTMDGADWHWLRFPYLRIGNTPEKRQAIAAFLTARGYRIAEITFGNDDWAYTEPYVRCLVAGDKKSIAWMKSTYLSNTAKYIDNAQTLSRTVYGRDIPHIALLHLGGFTVATLPDLLALMKKRGTHFVTLEEAESDSAFAHVMEDSIDSGGTFLERMARARHLPQPPYPPPPFDTLKTMCPNSKLDGPGIP